jgi:hypothetical protein
MYSGWSNRNFEQAAAMNLGTGGVVADQSILVALARAWPAATWASAFVGVLLANLVGVQLVDVLGWPGQTAGFAPR